VSSPTQPPDNGRGADPGPMRFVGLGVQLAASLLVLVWLGQWVDRRLHTGGIATVLGAAIAFAGTMVSLIRELNRKDREGPGRARGLR